MTASLGRFTLAAASGAFTVAVLALAIAPGTEKAGNAAWILAGASGLVGVWHLRTPRMPTWAAASILLVGAGVLRLRAFEPVPWLSALVFSGAAIVYLEMLHLSLRARQWREASESATHLPINAIALSVLLRTGAATAVAAGLFGLHQVLLRMTPDVVRESVERNLGWRITLFLGLAILALWIAQGFGSNSKTADAKPAPVPSANPRPRKAPSEGLA